MTFTEEWFSPSSCETLAQLASNIGDVDGDIVEIGCWEGRSTITLANAVAPRIVHAVDTWEGSPGEPSQELAKQRNIYRTFRKNVRQLTDGNVKAHRMGWRDILPSVQRIAFLFIDAEHTYQEVADTIAAAWPKMVTGGIICGDDAHHAPVRQAVLDAFPQASVKASVWSQVKP